MRLPASPDAFGTGLVLRFKNRRVDSRRNYSHAAASFGYWALAGDFGQPVTVCDHAAPQFRYARNFHECAAFARNRFAGHLKIGQGLQGCI